mgnify:CR=1 FL=1
MRADKAGHYRYAMSKELGGQEGGNLGMAIIREHLATRGLGLHNDLQNEHSIVERPYSGGLNSLNVITIK